MIEKIKKQLRENGKVSFKIYSLVYIIENKEKDIIIYPELYPYKKEYYNNIDTLLDYYLIFNENIRDI